MFDTGPEPATAPHVACANLEILFFGKLADRFGRRLVVEIPAAGCSIADLKARLRELAPETGPALDEPGVRWAVDREIGVGEVTVLPGQEVAFLSVFSGG